MPAPSRAAAVLLFFLADASALAQPATGPWDMTGAPRVTVTADTPREAGEVPIEPNRTLSLLFDTPVQREGVVLEERGHFRQVSLSEDGLLLTLLLSGELPVGRRLVLTVRFADGATPASVDFTLVVFPRAEPQVEVYRHPRPGDSYRRQSEEVEARLQQCQAERARERAERGIPRGLTGLLALKQMDINGVRARDVVGDITLRPGEAFKVASAVSYRVDGGDKEASVVRLAVDLLLWNQGSRPWTPTHAQLVARGGRWEAQVWPPEPVPSGGSRRLLVEMELPRRVPPGPYRLELWDERGPRAVTLSGVTFP